MCTKDCEVEQAEEEYRVSLRKLYVIERRNLKRGRDKRSQSNLLLLLFQSIERYSTGLSNSQVPFVTLISMQSKIQFLPYKKKFCFP